MFGKLKDKLKGAFGKFAKSVDEEAEDVVEPVVNETPVKVKVSKPKVVEKKVISKPIKPKDPIKSKPEVSVKSESKPVVVAKIEDIEPDGDLKVDLDVKLDDLADVVKNDSDVDVSESKKGFFKKIFSKKDEKVLEDIEEKEIVALEEEVEAISSVKEIELEFDNLPDGEKANFVEEKKFLEDETSVEIQADEKIIEELEQTKKSIFSKVKESITRKKISESKFEELFFEIEVALLESNVSFDVVDKIKEDLKVNLVNNSIPRSEIMDVILNTLKSSIDDLFKVPGVDLLKLSDSKNPLIISFIGVNGSGKTTQVAKIAKMFQDAGKSVVIGACDTFRAAAIHQLEEHATNLKIKMIKHDYGADAAAVAFDTISHAKSKKIDVVLLDTAGRLHSNVNLMNELEKLMRISDPDFNIFVGESITGNDCVEQATLFGESVRIDGIILTKADVDDKGGAALSISYVTKKPILFFGVGQGYDDLVPFTKKLVIDNLGL